jgi:hypothetical protein
MESKYEEKNEDQITCPYCGWECSDSWDFNSDEEDFECPDCEKHFSIEIRRSVDYITKPDCELNKKEHEWKDLTDIYGKPYPDEKFKNCQRCAICDKFRVLREGDEGYKG